MRCEVRGLGCEVRGVRCEVRGVRYGVWGMGFGAKNSKYIIAKTHFIGLIVVSFLP